MLLIMRLGLIIEIYLELNVLSKLLYYSVRHWLQSPVDAENINDRIIIKH